jgi:hypothetical protein
MKVFRLTPLSSVSAGDFCSEKNCVKTVLRCVAWGYDEARCVLHFGCGAALAAPPQEAPASPTGRSIMLDAATRRSLIEAIDRATRAGLRPANREARPGHPSRFSGIPTVVSRGREVTYPTLEEQEARVTHRPQILRALNG